MSPCSAAVRRSAALPGISYVSWIARSLYCPQKLERPRALGLGDRLRSKVGRADRVRVVDDVRAAVLIPADGETQPEREDQADHAEHGSLQHSDRLSVGVVLSPRVPAEHSTPTRAAPPITPKIKKPSSQLESEKNTCEEARRTGGHRSPHGLASRVARLRDRATPLANDFAVVEPRLLASDQIVTDFETCSISGTRHAGIEGSAARGNPGYTCHRGQDDGR